MALSVSKTHAVPHPRRWHSSSVSQCLYVSSFLQPPSSHLMIILIISTTALIWIISRHRAPSVMYFLPQYETSM
jgi:hypothetical protein